MDYMTDEGLAPWLQDYGLIPMGIYGDQYGYNVQGAHAVLTFGVQTGGTNLVKILANMSAVPVHHVSWTPQDGAKGVMLRAIPEEVAKWLTLMNCGVLCIAGNRERKNPGIGEFVTEWLMRCFERMKELDKRRF